MGSNAFYADIGKTHSNSVQKLTSLNVCTEIRLKKHIARPIAEVTCLKSMQKWVMGKCRMAVAEEHSDKRQTNNIIQFPREYSFPSINRELAVRCLR